MFVKLSSLVGGGGGGGGNLGAISLPYPPRSLSFSSNVWKEAEVAYKAGSSQ